MDKEIEGLMELICFIVCIGGAIAWPLIRIIVGAFRSAGLIRWREGRQCLLSDCSVIIHKRGLRDKAQLFYNEATAIRLRKDKTGILGACLLVGGGHLIDEELAKETFGRLGVDYQSINPKWYVLDKVQYRFVNAINQIVS